ncbi:MAG: RdgB/HAM1 family non-canonical purine NTP pyrophosphatase [candidate division NC10 bacterium]|nr:RdgB/HAM1 family non-canonical purine NTP pyrophosphatase [candidate division NC10 bacterium]
MDLVIATHNPGKFREIAEILGDLPIRLLPLASIPRVSLPAEDGWSLEENALKKAQVVAESTGKWALADDSGLEIEALGGGPGLLSARFLGEEADPHLRNQRILELLADIPLEGRGAQFRCVIAIAEPGGRTYIAEGACGGFIATASKGEGGFGYDPIFLVPEYSQTMAELDPAIKNRVSHRAKALLQARKILEALLEPPHDSSGA